MKENNRVVLFSIINIYSNKFDWSIVNRKKVVDMRKSMNGIYENPVEYPHCPITTMHHEL